MNDALWRGPGRMVMAILAAAALAAGQLAPAAALASGGRWTVQPTPNAVLANGTLIADSCSGPARCMAVGSFATSAGTSPLAEAWNGTAWRVLVPPVPAGASHGVLTAVSCATASACVAVGYDSSASGVRVTLAETWNGATWAAQAPPDPPGARGSLLQSVSCATVTSCVATGYSVHPHGGPAALAESWNGTAWTLRPVAVPSGSVYTALYGVSCASASACTAVGRYLDSSSDLWLTLAERWNGHAWAAQATPNPGPAIVSTLYAVSCPTATACTAVGDFINRNGSGSSLGATLAEVWNGSAWTIQPTPDPASQPGIAALYGVSCSSAHACSAVGYYNPTVSTGTATLAVVLHGSAWTIQPTADPGRPVSELSGVSCTGASACTAVGHYRSTGHASMTLAELRNGATWAAEPTPSPPGAFPSILDSISCPAATACTAVGFYRDGSATGTLALGWNGTAWSVQPAVDLAGAARNQLNAVSCAAADACIAVGEATRGRGPADPLAEAWNGSAWAIQHLPSPSPAGGDLEGVSCTAADACVAVGYHYTSSGEAEPLAERWDGTTWTVQRVPGVAGGNGFELKSVSCSSATACTAAGSYEIPGNVVALAERWNGTAWHVQATPAGTDILYGVSCASATACIAVGDSYSFPGPGAQVGPLAEAWNGSVWRVQVTQDPAGSFFTSFYGVSCRSRVDCAAVGGYHNTAVVPVPVTLAEHWNGATWTIQPTPGFAGRGSVLAAVSALPGGGFTAVGSRADAALVSRTLAEVTR